LSHRSVVLISGGSNGIGRETAIRFAASAQDVIVWGRDAQRLQSLEQSGNGNITTDRVDVTRPEEVTVGVEKIVAAHQQIDTIICAAGYPKPITTGTDYQAALGIWRELLDVNLTGAFATVMAAAPHLRHPGARVILIGSGAALTGSVLPGGLGYAAAKAGLSGLTFALAREFGPMGSTVNLVIPGFIEQTGITNHWPETITRAVINQTPMGRAGSARDVASAIEYLASHEAGFITGQVIQINGGMVMGR
jgi:3-oxoacyl-[acyl-carrier protein] reductase